MSFHRTFTRRLIADANEAQIDLNDIDGIIIVTLRTCRSNLNKRQTADLNSIRNNLKVTDGMINTNSNHSILTRVMVT